MRDQTSIEPSSSNHVGAPEWLPLNGEEDLLWRDQRRVWTILPAVIAGSAMILTGLFALADVVPALGPAGPVFDAVAVLLVFAGLFLAGWRYLDVTNTEYAVTDDGVYRKRGILSRRVTAVDYETIQNVSYSQNITGVLFDHGSLGFDTAGGMGTELSFRDVDDPTAVQKLVSERLTNRGQCEDADELPGTIEQWEAVLEEVREIRRALEPR